MEAESLGEPIQWTGFEDAEPLLLRKTSTFNKIVGVISALGSSALLFYAGYVLGKTHSHQIRDSHSFKKFSGLLLASAFAAVNTCWMFKSASKAQEMTLSYPKLEKRESEIREHSKRQLRQLLSTTMRFTFTEILEEFKSLAYLIYDDENLKKEIKTRITNEIKNSKKEPNITSIKKDYYAVMGEKYNESCSVLLFTDEELQNMIDEWDLTNLTSSAFFNKRGQFKNLTPKLQEQVQRTFPWGSYITD